MDPDPKSHNARSFITIRVKSVVILALRNRLAAIEYKSLGRPLPLAVVPVPGAPLPGSPIRFSKPAHSSQSGRRCRVSSLFAPCSDDSTESTKAKASAKSTPARFAKLFAHRLRKRSANDRTAVGDGDYPPSIIAENKGGNGRRNSGLSIRADRRDFKEGARKRANVRHRAPPFARERFNIASFQADQTEFAI
jgi:hypothetical protein